MSSFGYEDICFGAPRLALRLRRHLMLERFSVETGLSPIKECFILGQTSARQQL